VKTSGLGRSFFFDFPLFADLLNALDMTESKFELTVLMPCLNEARTVATCVKAARAYMDESGIQGEVLVADNGSTDGSVEVAEMAGARVVRVPTRGYGAALMAGISAARGRWRRGLQLRFFPFGRLC